jgi:NTP pyrophosphatase (non-canonical NTP hydrolase)
MNDAETTVALLRKIVEQFVDQRDWHRFHTPKNLAMSLAIEAAEVMEHFQWLTPEQSWEVTGRPEQLAAVSDELADVFCYALAMANELGVDVTKAILAKMAKNEQKYPADEYRGRYGPDDPGWQDTGLA